MQARRWEVCAEVRLEGGKQKWNVGESWTSRRKKVRVQVDIGPKGEGRRGPCKLRVGKELQERDRRSRR